jgi:hypothetical protein
MPLLIAASAEPVEPTDSPSLPAGAILFEDSMKANWERNWFLDGKLGFLKHWNGGLYLAAGPLTKWGERAFGVEEPTEYNAHHIVLWTRQSYEDDIRVSYRFVTQPNSEGTQLLYIQAQGVGTPPHVPDIHAWRQLREIPGMDQYYNHMDLISLSLRDEIRCRRYPWQDSEGVPYGKRGLFEPMVGHPGLAEGTPYALQVEKRKASLRLIIRDLAKDEETVDHTWDLSKTEETRRPLHVEAGRIRIRLMGGAKILLRDFKIERLGGIQSKDSND